MSELEEVSDVVPCPECRAENASGMAFCTACGVKLVGAAPVARAVGARTRRKSRAAGDAIEQARARQEFGRIKGIVTTVRSVFAAGAVFALVQVLLWHVVVAKVGAGDLGGWRMLITIVLWGQIVLMVAGALLVLRSPLVWTTVGACYATLNLALGLWTTDFSFDLKAKIGGFLLVAFWFAVAQAARVQRLMAADPKLQIVRKPIDPSRRVVGGVADEARERRREDRRRALRSRLKMFGAVAGLVAIAGGAVWQLTRPPSSEAIIAAFSDAWRGNDVEGIGNLFPGGSANVRAIALRESLEHRGWQRSMPGLLRAEFADHDDRTTGTYACAGGELQVTFERDRGGWHLSKVVLPKFEVPDFAPGLAAFRTAWQAQGTDQLVAMFRPQSRERLGGALRRMLEKRQWHEQRPALGDVDLAQASQDRPRVFFAMGDDELEVTFDYWHPSWMLAGVKLPHE
jgi:hypothetical protein